MKKLCVLSFGLIIAFVSVLASCAAVPPKAPPPTASPCTPPPDDVLLTSNISLDLIGKATEAFQVSVRAGIQPNVTDLIGQGARHDLIRQYIRCLMQNEMNLTPAQIAWYESCERFFATQPSPREAAEYFATTPFPGAPPAKNVPFDVRVQVATRPEDANLLQQDWEVDSDDWTGVDVSYELSVTADGRRVLCNLVWNVKELEKDKSYRRKTHIQSRKAFDVYEVPPMLHEWKVEIAQNTRGSYSDLVRGERHDLVRLPDFGALSDINVQFDGPNSDDKDRQLLLANLRAELILVRR